VRNGAISLLVAVTDSLRLKFHHKRVVVLLRRSEEAEVVFGSVGGSWVSQS